MKLLEQGLLIEALGLGRMARDFFAAANAPQSALKPVFMIDTSNCGDYCRGKLQKLPKPE